MEIVQNLPKVLFIHKKSRGYANNKSARIFFIKINDENMLQKMTHGVGANSNCSAQLKVMKIN